MSLSMVKLHNEMSRASQLPVVVVQALRLLGQKDPDFESLVKAISSDPVIVSRLIAIANSPFMGRVAKVKTARSACVSLGLNAVRCAILTTGVAQRLRPANSPLVVTELWAHAFGVAAAARCVAPVTGVAPDAAYTAGLLHDLGKLVLAHCATQEYLEMLAWQQIQDCFAIDAERRMLGIDHVEVGIRMATLWKLPEELMDAIAHHHTPSRAQHRELVDTVHIADVLARCLELGNPGDDLVPAIDPEIAERYSLNGRLFARYFGLIEVAYQEVLEFLE